jgi:hypothetical protein
MPETALTSPLTIAFKFNTIYKPWVFLCCAIGDSPIPTKVTRLIVKTDSALIYKNKQAVIIGHIQKYRK